MMIWTVEVMLGSIVFTDGVSQRYEEQELGE